MIKSSKLNTGISVLAFSLAIAMPHAAMAQDGATSVNIPAQSLDEALREFSRETGYQFVYSADVVAGKRSQSVGCDCTADQALARLLAGTGLSFHNAGGRTFSLQAGSGAVGADGAAEEGERVLGPVRVEGAQGGAGGVAVRGEGIARPGGIRGRQDDEADGYRAKVSSVAVGAPIPIEDIPRSITVQTQDQLENQEISDLGSALRRLPGVTFVDVPLGGTSEVRAPQVYVRGQILNRIQVDGGASRPLDLGPNGLVSIDAYERVELVRGPNSLQSGADSAGGSINLVRKRPGTDYSQSIEFELGTLGRRGVVADISTPRLFGSPIGFRAVGSSRADGGGIDHYRTSTESLYAIFDVPFSEDARLEFGGLYDRTYVNGRFGGALRSAEGDLFDLPRSFNVDVPGAYVESSGFEIFSKLYASLSEKWRLDFGIAYRSRGDASRYLDYPISYRTDGSAVFYFPGAGGIYDNRRTPTNFLESSINLSGSFETFGLNHALVFSASRTMAKPAFGLEENKLASLEAETIDDFINPVFEPVVGYFPIVVAFRANSSTTTGVAISDTISFRDLATFTVAARYDNFENCSAQNTTSLDGTEGVEFGLNCRKAQSSLRPNFAATIKPFRNVTLFGSFSDGFSRQDTLFSRSGEAPNYVYTPLGPIKYANKEIGVKMGGRRWTASLTAFDNNQKGSGVPLFGLDFCPPALGPSGFSSRCYAQGTQDSTSRGVDFEFSGRIADGLSLLANANYNHTKSKQEFSEGQSLQTLAPQSSASLFLDWAPNFAPDLALRFGARYKSRYYAKGFKLIYGQQPDDITRVDYEVSESGSLVFDIGAEYALSDNLALKLFIENITDKTYFSTPSADSGGFYGRPRSFLATLRWQDQKSSSSTASGALFGDPSKWYAAFDVGLSLPGDVDARAEGKAQDGISPVKWNFDLKRSQAYSVRIGRELSDNWRAELDLHHAANGIGTVGGNAVAPFGLCGAQDALTGAPFDCDNVPGRFTTWGLYGNILYDFASPQSPIRPFIGAGVDVARQTVVVQGKMQGIGGDSTWYYAPFPDFPDFLFGDTQRATLEGFAAGDTRLAPSWQLIAGASAKLNDRFSIDASWRWINTPTKWDSYNLGVPSVLGDQPLTPRLERFKGTSQTHFLTLGLRWKFGN